MPSLTPRPALLALLAAALAYPVAAGEDRPQQSDTQEKSAAASQAENGRNEGEWTTLFGGESLDAWRAYRGEKIGEGWKVVDGALTRVANAGDIVTKDKYAAFELVLEYKIAPGGNSGVMYHVTEQHDVPWKSGPEVQVQDNAGGHDPQKSGWLYQLYKSDVDATKPADEWNELRLVITPDKSEQYVNGVKYFEYDKGSEDWDARVAKSKFAAFEGFGEVEEGHIALQDHGNRVAYRNIKIRELK